MFDINILLASLTRSRAAVHALNGLILAVLVSSIVYWSFFYMNQRYSALLGGTQSSAAPGSSAGINVDELIANHLFGVPSTRLGASIQADIPLSSLNLRLTGIIASDRGGFALISVNGQPQTPFFLGEIVVDNALLDAVLPDRVILLRDGIRESLLLDPDHAGSADRQPVSAPPHADHPLPGRSIQEIGNNRFQVSRDEVARNVNNTDILRQALIVPNPKGGFVVKNVQSGSVIENLGLRAGDIITKVNNLEINSMVDVMQLYRLTGDIDKIQNIKVEVTRNGNRETLHYSLN